MKKPRQRADIHTAAVSEAEVEQRAMEHAPPEVKWLKVGLEGEPVSTDECRRVFETVPFMDALSEHDIHALASRMRSRNFVAGTTLFHEDDESDAVYFLAGGAIEIFKSDQSGKKLPLTILREHGLLGEMGLLNSTPRTATARALSSVRVLYFTNTDFYDSLHGGSVPVHRLVLAFARILAQRLTVMNEKIFEIFESEFEGDQPQDVNEFKRRLMTTWTRLSLEPQSF